MLAPGARYLPNANMQFSLRLDFKRIELRAEADRLIAFQSKGYRQRDVKFSQRDGLERARIVCQSGLREADQFVAMNTRLMFQSLCRAGADLRA
jgi:hypothetical protein